MRVAARGGAHRMRPARLFVALWLCAGLCAVAAAEGRAGFPVTSTPAFQVDHPMPTADKPQSKLWFMHGHWWALLPRADGPSLWQRTDRGWAERPEVVDALRGRPGRADVWPGIDNVTAVALADLTKTNLSLTVLRLTRDGESDAAWNARVLAELYPPSAADAMETATLAQDAAGAWWVAAVAGVNVCVWTAPSCASDWSGPAVLAQGVDDDDICVVTPLPNGEMGVIWSDQVRDAVVMRRRLDSAPVGDWMPEEVIEMGGQTADDHLNTVLVPDGTLWVACKNEVDTAGQPQFILRMRSRDGSWTDSPYGMRTETTRPSRPIVVASEDGAFVFTGYGDNDRAVPSPHDSRIVFGRVDRTQTPVGVHPQTVIAPDAALNSFVQNVTGPRHPFPKGVPWLVLASDQEGRVYEFDLRHLLTPATGEDDQWPRE